MIMLKAEIETQGSHFLLQRSGFPVPTAAPKVRGTTPLNRKSRRKWKPLLLKLSKHSNSMLNRLPKVLLLLVFGVVVLLPVPCLYPNFAICIFCLSVSFASRNSLLVLQVYAEVYSDKLCRACQFLRVSNSSSKSTCPGVLDYHYGTKVVSFFGLYPRHTCK